MHKLVVLVFTYSKYLWNVTPRLAKETCILIRKAKKLTPAVAAVVAVVVATVVFPEDVGVA